MVRLQFDVNYIREYLVCLVLSIIIHIVPNTQKLTTA